MTAALDRYQAALTHEIELAVQLHQAATVLRGGTTSQISQQALIQRLVRDLDLAAIVRRDTTTRLLNVSSIY